MAMGALNLEETLNHYYSRSVLNKASAACNVKFDFHIISFFFLSKYLIDKFFFNQNLIICNF